jgi:crotonobetainyl-CoA:carnitine CoA-transferase CaiB-like acyl-CoA transferase
MPGATLRSLIGSADVFMENLPGKLAALEPDYETISAQFPRVLRCST